jgi:hypothetical protein
MVKMIKFLVGGFFGAMVGSFYMALKLADAPDSKVMKIASFIKGVWEVLGE